MQKTSNLEHKPALTKPSMDMPLVSILIPTLNAENTLEKCLVSIVSQTYKNLEIIVVDKFSVDNTVNVARRYGARVFSHPGPERTSQVNYGAKIASGEYIYYIGADFVLDEDLVKKSIEKMLDRDADGIKIPNLAIARTFLGKCRALEKLMNIGEDIVEVPRFMKKDVFLRLGGYDENLTAGEEWDLGMRFDAKGYRAVRITEVAEWHIDEPQDLKKIMLRALYYGSSVYGYVRKNPNKAMIQYLPIRVFWLKKWRKHTRYPLNLLGLICMKNIEYFAATMGKIFHFKRYYKH